MKNLLSALALITAVGTVAPEAKAQSLITGIWLAGTNFQITVSNTGSSVYYEIDIADSNFRSFVDALQLWDANQKPLDLIFHCCGTQGTYHIDAIQTLAP